MDVCDVERVTLLVRTGVSVRLAVGTEGENVAEAVASAVAVSVAITVVDSVSVSVVDWLP